MRITSRQGGSGLAGNGLLGHHDARVVCLVYLGSEWVLLDYERSGRRPFWGLERGREESKWELEARVVEIGW